MKISFIAVEELPVPVGLTSLDQSSSLIANFYLFLMFELFGTYIVKRENQFLFCRFMVFI